MLYFSLIYLHQEPCSIFFFFPTSFHLQIGMIIRMRNFTRGRVVFFQVPKDWEMGLGVIGDEFFSILPKFLDLETLLATFGDALRT